MTPSSGVAAGTADCSAVGANGWRGASSEQHKGLLVGEGADFS